MKATKIEEISTLHFYVVNIKSMVEISLIFVIFLENLNFM